ncbi:MAG TPA: site-specific DNA-methyltransferase [Mycobacteriales bacterium]
MTARMITADVLDGLASLDDDSVDLVLASPPFLGLRSYLPEGHASKGREIGSESTPADFLDRLLDVVEACDRVLAPHGSLVFELGDTYAGSGGAGGDYGQGGLREGQHTFAGSAAAGRAGDGWPAAKSLCGIPTLFAWSLAYGRNLLRPERETDPWMIRNVVAWCRPNPAVGALADKFRPATSYLTVATKARDRYFDMDAVRAGRATDSHPIGHTDSPTAARRAVGLDSGRGRTGVNPGGAPPLDWWEIPTQPYAGAHYAAWPEALLVRPILSMCAERVCRVCGRPSRPSGCGWSDCGCDWPYVGHQGDSPDDEHGRWRRGVVLDPFAGSGTTLAAAERLGRDSVGIDIDDRNVALARDRVGRYGVMDAGGRATGQARLFSGAPA